MLLQSTGFAMFENLDESDDIPEEQISEQADDRWNSVSGEEG